MALEGFGDEGQSPARRRFEHLIGITGHLEQSNSRHQCLNLCCELRAGHPGHHDVGQDEVRRRRHALQSPERIQPVTGLLNVMPATLSMSLTAVRTSSSSSTNGMVR